MKNLTTTIKMYSETITKIMCLVVMLLTINLSTARSEEGVAKFDDRTNVALLMFTADAVASEVQLKWVTASEINNDHYTIERSVDGNVFTQIGTVTGGGNSSTSLDYSFTDSSPLNGVTYYRLTQTAFDSSSTNSDIIAVRYDNNNFLNILSCSKDSGMIELYYSNNETSEIQLEIIDDNGNSVYTTKIFSTDVINHVRLNVPLQKDGNYLITLSTGTEVGQKSVLNK